MIPTKQLKVNGPNIVHDTIAGEVVIVNLKSGSYYSLDKVGADIWDLIVRGNVVNEMVERVAQRYEGARAEMEKAINELVAELLKEDLVVAVPPEEVGSIADPNSPLDSGTGAEKLRFEAPILQKYTDMQDLLLLDPIHEVDETGWPNVRQDNA